MSSRYNHKVAEKKWQKEWINKDIFSAKKNTNQVENKLSGKRTYSITAYEFSEMWAELQGDGTAKISLAELAQGRLIAKYAKDRASLSGHSEEYIIDLLMRGIMPTSAISRMVDAPCIGSDQPPLPIEENQVAA